MYPPCITSILLKQCEIIVPTNEGGVSIGEATKPRFLGF